VVVTHRLFVLIGGVRILNFRDARGPRHRLEASRSKLCIAYVKVRIQDNCHDGVIEKLKIYLRFVSVAFNQLRFTNLRFVSVLVAIVIAQHLGHVVVSRPGYKDHSRPVMYQPARNLNRAITFPGGDSLHIHLPVLELRVSFRPPFIG
jgi:hypothetical protein